MDTKYLLLRLIDPCLANASLGRPAQADRRRQQPRPGLCRRQTSLQEYGVSQGTTSDGEEAALAATCNR